MDGRLGMMGFKPFNKNSIWRAMQRYFENSSECLNSRVQNRSKTRQGLFKSSLLIAVGIHYVEKGV